MSLVAIVASAGELLMLTSPRVRRRRLKEGPKHLHKPILGLNQRTRQQKTTSASFLALISIRRLSRSSKLTSREKRFHCQKPVNI